MAKKKAATKKAAPAKKGPAAKTGKKKPAHTHEDDEVVLEPIEEKAIELARSSEDVCHELEMAVTAALTTAVQKVFKTHKIALTAAAAEKVAFLLFGD